MPVEKSELDAVLSACDDYELGVIEAVMRRLGILWLCPPNETHPHNWDVRGGERCPLCGRESGDVTHDD